MRLGDWDVTSTESGSGGCVTPTLAPMLKRIVSRPDIGPVVTVKVAVVIPRSPKSRYDGDTLLEEARGPATARVRKTRDVSIPKDRDIQETENGWLNSFANK